MELIAFAFCLLFLPMCKILWENVLPLIMPYVLSGLVNFGKYMFGLTIRLVVSRTVKFISDIIITQYIIESRKAYRIKYDSFLKNEKSLYLQSKPKNTNGLNNK